MKNPIRDTVRDRLDEKADKVKTYYGYLGNYEGTVVVPGKTGFVYVTMPDGVVMQAYNTIAPIIRNLPVICGYDPRQARSDLFRVLDVRDLPRANVASTAVNLSTMHHSSHEWLNASGGTDVVYTHLRQFLPLRPQPVAPYGIYINRAVFLAGSTWISAGNVMVDLTAHVPASASGSFGDERFVLISINGTSGSIIATAGSVAASGSSSMAMIPAVPSGHFPICAVRLYSNQEYIIETRSQNDLIDMRWGMFRGSGTSGSGGATMLAELTDVNIGSQTDGQVLMWDDGSSKWIPGTVTSGSGGTSGSQVVPLDHDPVAGFYLTGYNATAGSFSSGSVVGGTSGSGGGIEEAPEDGKIYGRKDAGWTEVTSGSSAGTTDVLMVQVFS